MKINKSERTYVLAGIVCDVCGKECPEPGVHPGYGPEYATLFAEWGYFSRRDGTKSECDLCEGCFERVVSFIESIGGKVRSMHNGWPVPGVDYVVRDDAAGNDIVGDRPA
jgi:hypothetical protein